MYTDVYVCIHHTNLHKTRRNVAWRRAGPPDARFRLAGFQARADGVGPQRGAPLAGCERVR
jgi:hypothetical protein